MKFTKYILAVALIAVASLLTAAAQSGFDYYSVPRTIVVTPGTLLGTTVYSNKPIDLHNLSGIAKLDVSVTTNGAAGLFSFSVYTSPDLTNYTALANVSYAASTTINITNNTYSTAIVGTNVTLLPGTPTTPNAATAGFATTYLLGAPFTNTTTTVVANSGGTFSLGFNVGDANRYLSIQYTPSANNTNENVFAVLTARPQQPTIIK